MTPRKNPAETGGVLGSAATAIAVALHASEEWVAVSGIVAGLIPFAVTFIVSNGGVRGLCSKLYRGR